MTFTGLDALAANGDVAAFAQANGLRFDQVASPPVLGGGPFERYTSGYVIDGVSGPGWQTGNLQSETPLELLPTSFAELAGTVVVGRPGSDDPSTPLGFVSLTLPRQLPNLVLDAKRNNSLFGSSLLYAPIGNQRLSLEGDFDDYFNLYAPTGYERDALYVFTPDLMALMIDETSDFDVEIRGDQLVVYATQGLDLSKPATWLWIERIMSVVGAKTFRRADGYADERVGNVAANTIAPEGQALRRTILSSENRTIAMAFALIVGLGVLGAIAVGVMALVYR